MVIREGLVEEVTFQLSPTRWESAMRRAIRKSIPEGIAYAKALSIRKSLAVSRN